MLRVAFTALVLVILGLAATAASASAPPSSLTIHPKSSSGLAAFASARAGAELMWVGPLSGNGGRDVMLYIPAGTTPGRSFRAIYHFHGTYSERIERPQPGRPKKATVGWTRLEQTLDAADELQAKGEHNIVVVYPLSAGRRVEPDAQNAHRVQYDRLWMQAESESFTRLRSEVEDLLRSRLGASPPTLVVEGHSAGGIALRNIAESHPGGIAAYLFLDASFEGWAEGCYAASQRARTPAKIVLVVTTDGIADAVGRWKPWCIDLRRDAAQWVDHRAWCKTHAGPPPGTPLPCDELRTRGEQWQKSGPWCDAMTRNFEGWPRVSMVRTRVRHGDQPRRFTGGLDLPADIGL